MLQTIGSDKAVVVEAQHMLAFCQLDPAIDCFGEVLVGGISSDGDRQAEGFGYFGDLLWNWRRAAVVDVDHVDRQTGVPGQVLQAALGEIEAIVGGNDYRDRLGQPDQMCVLAAALSDGPAETFGVAPQLPG